MPGLSNFKIEKDIKRQLCCGIQLGKVKIRFAFQMHNTFDVDVDDDVCMCGVNMFCAKLLIYRCAHHHSNRVPPTGTAMCLRVT